MTCSVLTLAAGGCDNDPVSSAFMTISVWMNVVATRA